MKKYAFLLITWLPIPLLAQLQPANPVEVSEAEKLNKYVLPIAVMSVKGSHPVGINSTKTVHIVFPSEIKEVDAGIPEIITQITPSFSNVLKVKSITDTSFTESNLTVLTASGDLYSFIVNYQKNPEVLNINIQNNFDSDRKHSKVFNTSTFRNSEFLIPNINLSETEIRSKFDDINKRRRCVKNIGVQNQYISVFLENIYMDNALTYLSVKLNNHSNVNYPIDFVKIYLRDVEGAKRQVIQEEELKIVMMDNVNEVNRLTSTVFAVAIPRITISSDKQLEFEIYERKGGRHLRFPINLKIVSNAKSFKE